MAASNKLRIPVPTASSSASPLTPLPDILRLAKEQVPHSESEESTSPTSTMSVPAQVLTFVHPGVLEEDLTATPCKKKDKGKKCLEPEDSPLLLRTQQKDMIPRVKSPTLGHTPSNNPFQNLKTEE